jgi:hypothetical protein
MGFPEFSTRSMSRLKAEVGKPSCIWTQWTWKPSPRSIGFDADENGQSRQAQRRIPIASVRDFLIRRHTLAGKALDVSRIFEKAGLKKTLSTRLELKLNGPLKKFQSVGLL